MVQNFTLLVPGSCSGASGRRDDIVIIRRLTDGQLQGLLQRLGLLGVREVGADTTKWVIVLEDLEDNATYLAVYADPAPMDTKVGGLILHIFILMHVALWLGFISGERVQDMIAFVVLLILSRHASSFTQTSRRGTAFQKLSASRIVSESVMFDSTCMINMFFLSCPGSQCGGMEGQLVFSCGRQHQRSPYAPC